MSAVTIADVARAAGVSTATVSRVLNGTGTTSEQIRERVLATTAQLGYVSSASASSLASGRTRNVGVVVPALNRWFFSSVVEGAQSELLRAGYDLTLYNLRDGGEIRERIFSDFLRRQRVDGVIAISLELSEEEVSNLRLVRKPVVGIGGQIAGIVTFEVDNVALSAHATEYLIGLGHRRIVHLGSSPDLPTAFRQGEKRYAGYVQAMQAHGYDVVPNDFTADYTVAGGYAVGRRILESPTDRPTAIFAATDEMAIGLMLAARELDISIPDDLSVIGVDNHELAASHGLTTIAQHPEQQGALAAAHLMRQLQSDEPAPASVEALTWKLVTRSTTAPRTPLPRISSGNVSGT